MNGERESGKPVLAAQHDDNDEFKLGQCNNRPKIIFLLFAYFDCFDN